MKIITPDKYTEINRRVNGIHAGMYTGKRDETAQMPINKGDWAPNHWEKHSQNFLKKGVDIRCRKI